MVPGPMIRFRQPKTRPYSGRKISPIPLLAGWSLVRNPARGAKLFSYLDIRVFNRVRAYSMRPAFARSTRR
jgi:hypothetical protein